MKREHLEEYKRVGRMVRAAMYLRKSRAEEHMNLEETLAKHRAALTAFAEKYGFLVDEADIYKEVVSGESLFSRPQMLRLLEGVNAGSYEAVLCVDLQRLGRGGMYDQGFILDTFKFSETLIVTPERTYDLTKEEDEQAAELETFMSRGEYRLITKRLQRGLHQVIEAGAYTANPPFGYRKAMLGKLSTLEIVPEEAEYVRQIFQLYADGNGCTKIEQAMNALGVHGRRGSRFNRNTIRLILDNPVYIGKIRWNRTSTVRSGIGSERQKKVVCNPPDRWQIINGRHPPIISPELWEKVQARRKSRYFYVDNHHVANPLAGLVRCSQCGRLMNLQGKNHGVPYLLCPTPGCSAGAKFEFVEQSVIRQLGEIADNLEVDVQTQTAPDTSALEHSLSLTKERLKKLDDRRSRLYTFLEDGTYTRDLFSQRMQLIAQEETGLTETAAQLEEEIRVTRSKDKRKQLSQLKTVLSRYEKASTPARKDLLRSVISVMTYTKPKKTKPADFTVSISLLDFF